VGIYGAHYVGLSLVLGAGLFTLWLLVTGCSIRDLSARAICTLTGHLRTRPDPWLECTLRKAFAEFDRELTVILRDRPGSLRAITSARPARPRDPESPADRPDEA
jgi:hypothetical protein